MIVDFSVSGSVLRVRAASSDAGIDVGLLVITFLGSGVGSRDFVPFRSDPVENAKPPISTYIYCSAVAVKAKK